MKSYVVIKISGNNINRFINKLISNKINIYELEKKSKNCIYVTIDKMDLDNLLKIRGIYDFEIIRYKGLYFFYKLFSSNLIIYLCLLISLIIIYFLSNFIFSIKVYHTNSTLKNELLDELANYDIKVGKYKKTYKQIEYIKNEILDKYKDKVEWLEITRTGTMYEIRLEERIINNDKEVLKPQNIVAKKHGIIKDIFASSGVIMKTEDDYVSPGDVIISGEIYLNDILKQTIAAKGVVYAETWYVVKVNYPLYYRDEKKTGNKKKILSIRILNNDYNLFNLNKYVNYNKKDKYLYKNNIIPLSFSIQEQFETVVSEYIYDVKTAEIQAINYATNKILSRLDDKEYIISKKVLKNDQKDSTIYMEIFFKVYEDITSTKEIVSLEEENL